MKKKLLILAAFAWGSYATAEAATRVFTLQECIDYALQHNITLKKAEALTLTQDINLKERKAAWLPTLSASLSESATWRPFQESAVTYVNGSLTGSSAKKVTESGSYGVNANWLVYNGRQREMNIESAELANKISQLSLTEQQNALVERIAQLYVQILYMQEAVKVNEKILHQDSIIWQRGVAFMENGKMARASVLELEATVSSGQYDLVNTRTQISQAKLELAQILELPAGESLDVAAPSLSDAAAMKPIPDRMDVYSRAVASRPEVKSAQLGIEQSQLATRIAKAARIPSISLNAGLNDSHMTGATNSFGQQLKNNFNANVGVGVSIPILDQRRVKSNVERAKVDELTAQLNLDDAKKTLYQNIEQYWLTATNSQQKFAASQSNVKSREASFQLLDEQFKVGLKNISDLLQSRTALLQSRQTLLQDKYTTVLYRSLLNFYGGEPLEF